MAEVIDGKADLNQLNDHLIERLDQVILATENAEDLLNLTEAVAKLNASFRNNDKFGAPMSDKEKADLEVQEMFQGRLSDAEVVNG